MMKLTNHDKQLIIDATFEKNRLLRLVDELSIKEMANHIGVSEGCVNNFIYRKRRKEWQIYPDKR